ncbi:hypothetical protein [Micromonospora sp. DT41]|uniref:phosphotriesterase family protein n=1 Tax=Micromonospora sp. DT41 TaxID=3393437 RepID=UPI003CF84776
MGITASRDGVHEALVLPHEHVLSRFRAADAATVRPFLRAELTRVAAAGVTDIVDLTAYVNPVSYLPLLGDTPVRIHACVGYYLAHAVRADLHSRSADDLAALLVRRYRRQCGKVSTVAIKVAARHGELTPLEQRTFTAAALAHHATGLPIVTHSPHGGQAHLNHLVRHGVHPEMVLVSHPEMGLKGRFKRPYDEVLTTIRRLLDAGAAVCVTDVTPLGSSADDSRLALVLDLIDRGHADRLTVSGDVSWAVRGGRVSFQGPAAAQRRGFELGLDALGKLRRKGVDEADLRRIFTVNPRRHYRLPGAGGAPK